MCRTNRDISKYDIVKGAIADDKVFDTVELYLDKLINKDEAIKRLRYKKPNMQICFRNNRVIKSSIEFIRGDRV